MPRKASGQDRTLRSKLSAKIRRDARPAEKQVRKTDRTVGVAPVKRGKGAKAPMPVVAADQRRQMVGTDEPKGQSIRTPKSGALGIRTGRKS